jgi:hypothetical protein
MDPDPHGYASFWEPRYGSASNKKLDPDPDPYKKIRIRIRILGRIRIRIKVMLIHNIGPKSNVSTHTKKD